MHLIMGAVRSRARVCMLHASMCASHAATSSDHASTQANKQYRRAIHIHLINVHAKGNGVTRRSYKEKDSGMNCQRARNRMSMNIVEGMNDSRQSMQ